MLYRTIILGMLFVHAGSSRATPATSPDVQTPGTPQQKSSVRHDPIEDDPNYQAVISAIDAEVNENLKHHPMRGGFGFVHIYWQEKKRVLHDKYGIEWRSPAEMNPHILFD